MQVLKFATKVGYSPKNTKKSSLHLVRIFSRIQKGTLQTVCKYIVCYWYIFI